MDPLSKEEEEKVTRILTRKNKYIWNQTVIPYVIQNLNNIRSGRVSLDDWFIQPHLTYLQYAYELGLHKYVI